ncbi:MAG: hypothetical protein WA706_06050, partial [Pseudolabrys sp.]
NDLSRGQRARCYVSPVQASDQILEEIERLTPARLHRDVGFTPESGHVQRNSACPLCANSGHLIVHSITSLASATNNGGRVRPSALAFVGLRKRSNLVVCPTGRALGFVPRRILST